MPSFGGLVLAVRGGESRKEFGFAIGYSPRQVEEVEKGGSEGSPDFALAVAKYRNRSDITLNYCRKQCPIGNVYSHEVLNNIDTHPMAIVAKLEEEIEEATREIGDLKKLVINKKSREDFTPAELVKLENTIQELIHVDHVLEILLHEFGTWVDIAQQIKLHRSKCYEKGYIMTKRNATPAGKQNVAR